MANYKSLKTTINANVKRNGNQEITGSVLNSVLNAMVDTLGVGYQFAGVATPSTNPGTPDAKVFYIANGKGTYTNFGGLEVTEDDVVYLYNLSDKWVKRSTGIAYDAAVIKKIRQNLSADEKSIVRENIDAASIDNLRLVRNNVFDLIETAISANYEEIKGYSIDTIGTLKENANYSISSPINLSAGQAIKISCYNHSGCAIALYYNDSYKPVVIAPNGSNLTTFIYEAISDCQVVVSWRSATAAPEYVNIIDYTYHSKIGDIDEKTKIITGGSEPITASLFQGYILNGVINSSSNYKYSSPIFLKKGIEIVVETFGVLFDVLSLTSELGDFYIPLIYVPAGDASTQRTFKYKATSDCYVSVCVRSANPYSISYSYPQIYDYISAIVNENNAATYNAQNNVGNLTIVAAKEHHYTDGTAPIIEWYLLQEPGTNRFYYSKDLSSKKYLYTFANAEKYSFGIVNNGDIIAVRLASSLPVTSSDSNRVNPYYFKASENWRIQHELDMGDAMKPCGWLENCGFLAMDNGDTLFVEYTRISVETCNVWKITGSVEDSANWHIVKSFTLSGEADAGLKHLHAVQQDFYNGVIYISTGDYKASSIYASTDNGDNFVAVLENNEQKCRSLAMTFTPDYVCWANDSVHHVFVRCIRDSNGIADIANADVINVPKTPNGAIAAYGQAYFREYDAVLLLDRQDGGGTATQMSLYVVDINTLNVYNAGTLKAVGSSNLHIGFRTLFSEWYPINGVMHIGFGFDSYTQNANAVCGNRESDDKSGVNTINNLKVYLNKIRDEYTISFGTFWL